jgi:hypothetical protein
VRTNHHLLLGGGVHGQEVVLVSVRYLFPALACALLQKISDGRPARLLAVPCVATDGSSEATLTLTAYSKGVDAVLDKYIQPGSAPAMVPVHHWCQCRFGTKQLQPTFTAPCAEVPDATLCICGQVPRQMKGGAEGLVKRR